jgi:hypothetical protein
MVEASLFDIAIETPPVSMEFTQEEDPDTEPVIEESADEHLTFSELDEEQEIEEQAEPISEEIESVEISEPAVSNEPQANFLDDITNPESTSINNAWILQIEQTIRSDRSVFPLETLIGSFSLNEKLQFINELYDGSSDAFSSATKKLDSCQNMGEAREQLSEFSSTYNWDLDSEIVEDFIFKICRRYATSVS